MEARNRATEARFWAPVAWTSLLVYALLCIGPWTESAWRPEWDSAVYLETARSLAAGAGYTYQGEPFFLRPPGLAWLLSFFVDAGPLPFEAFNRGIMACAAGTIVALFVLLRRFHGTPVALGIALLTGTSGFYVDQFNYVLSEFPYTLLLFLSIPLLHAFLEREKLSWSLGLLGALCLVAAFYLRTLAVLMLPGLLLLGVRHGRWKRALLPLGLIAISILPWFLYARASSARAEVPSKQFQLHDYSTALLHTESGDPRSPFITLGELGARVQRNGSLLAGNALYGLHLAERRRDAPAGGVSSRSSARIAWKLFIGAVLLGALLRAFLRGWTLLEWFLLGNVAVILIYFAYAPRLVMPVVPLFYLALLTLPFELPGSLGKRISLLLAAVLLVANVVRLPGHLDVPRRVRARWENVRATGAWAREHTPEGALLLSKHGPMTALLSGRRTYTAAFDRNPNILVDNGIDYVFFVRGAGSKLENEARRLGLRRWKLETTERTVVYRVK